MNDDLEALLAGVPALRGKRVAVTPHIGGISNRNSRLDAADESFVLHLGGQHTELLGGQHTELLGVVVSRESGVSRSSPVD